MKTDIDPITLAVIRGTLEQIADEMDAPLERMAFSPVISDGFDRASGIYDRENGEVIMQGPRGLPNFIYVMGFTVRSVIERIDNIAPDDVYIVNDPYLGGTHLMDVKMVKPFFYEGELFVFLANRGHWPDIGGMVPGGFAASTTEVFQEGLRIPPVKLYSRGKLNEGLLRLVLANVRVPSERRGDIQAHLAAFEVGEHQLKKLLDRYGRETVRMCMAELKVRSEQQMRSYLEEISDGTYEYTDYMDNDGIDQTPLQINLKMMHPYLKRLKNVMQERVLDCGKN